VSGICISPSDFPNTSQKLLFSSPSSLMGNFKEIELDELLTIFKLPSGGNHAVKESRIKRFMAANRGRLGRLCTCGKHTCGESDQDDNSSSPLPPKTPGNRTIISVRPKTGANPARTKFSFRTDSSPQHSSARASTSREDNTSSQPHVTPVRRPPATTATPAPSRSTFRTSSPRYSARGPLGSFPPLPGQPTSPHGAVTEVAEDTRKGVSRHLVPQSRKQSLSSDGTGQSITGKAPAKNLSPRTGRISNEDDGGGVQASNPSGPQRNEEKLQDLVPPLSRETKEDTRNHEKGDIEDGERQSSVGKGKDPVWIPSEENASEKVTQQETPFVVSNRLRESRFRAFGYGRKEKRVIRSNLDDIGDDEEIIPVAKIEPREEEDEKDEEYDIWEALEPGVQEVIEQGDYEDPEEFLKSWKNAAVPYDGNPLTSEFSHPDKIVWVYQGKIIN
jgi:hypothetical protein